MERGLGTHLDGHQYLTEFLNAGEGQCEGGGYQLCAGNAANHAYSPDVPELASSSLPTVLKNWPIYINIHFLMTQSL